jgi:hypothetical protein
MQHLASILNKLQKHVYKVLLQFYLLEFSWILDRFTHSSQRNGRYNSQMPVLLNGKFGVETSKDLPKLS